MPDSPRCLYSSDIQSFLTANRNEVLGILCDSYHGVLQTTQSDAWASEIDILQKALLPWKESNGKIIFEYDIPRLGKRIDVVVLLNGIIFCVEFKVGESEIKVGDVDQIGRAHV